jgi:hypothetical protein
MLILMDFFCLIVSAAKRIANSLSYNISVAGCACPRATEILHSHTPCWANTNVAPYSASPADDTTTSMIELIACIILFSTVGLSKSPKHATPPATDHALDRDRYDASTCKMTCILDFL